MTGVAGHQEQELKSHAGGIRSPDFLPPSLPPFSPENGGKKWGAGGGGEIMVIRV